MQWSQIKTLFILSFLILNIYLLIQFMSKLEEENYGILEYDDSSIEQKLEEENIVINSLPSGQEQEPFISVRQRIFSKEDIEKFKAHKNQEISIVNNNFIVSLFDEPVAIPYEAERDVVEGFVEKYFAFPEDYELWSWNKELNVMLFFQDKNDRPIYFNQNALILVFLNDKNEMVFYTQTMLGDSESIKEKKDLIKPITAVETLYNSNELRSGDEITKMEIGFHTRVPTEQGTQVFVPAWKVTVNKEKNYFVNAIEGWVFSSNEFDFLEDTMEFYLEKIQSMTDNKSMKEKIELFLNSKLDTDERSEEE